MSKDDSNLSYISYISYFDILGYEHLLKKFGGALGLAKIMDKHINGALTSIKTYSLFVEGFDEKNLEIRVFSDNFLIRSKANKNGRLMLLSLVFALQTTMLSDHIFIRGSICKGELLFWDKFVCGQGLIDAYKIESKLAIFPRIIVDKDFFHRDAESVICLENFISEDFDGLLFLDYLKYGMFLHEINRRDKDKISTIVENLNKHGIKAMPADNPGAKLLEVHRERIWKNIAQNVNRPEVLHKYMWCLKYHNNFCEQYGYDYLITPDYLTELNK